MSNDIRLFIGQSGGPNLYQLDSTFLDGEARYGVKAQSTPVAPAGQSADTILYGAYLSVTLSMGITLKITPVVDGVVLTQAARTVRLDSSTEERLERVEVGFAVPFVDENDPTFVLFYYAPRGIYVGIQVETQLNSPLNQFTNSGLISNGAGWATVGGPLAGVRESSNSAPYGYSSYWTTVVSGTGQGVGWHKVDTSRFTVVPGHSYEIRFLAAYFGTGHLADALALTVQFYQANHTTSAGSIAFPKFDADSFVWTPRILTFVAPTNAAEFDTYVLSQLAFVYAFAVTGFEFREITANIVGLDTTGYLSIDEAELDVESLIEGEPERTS